VQIIIPAAGQHQRATRTYWGASASERVSSRLPVVWKLPRQGVKSSAEPSGRVSSHHQDPVIVGQQEGPGDHGRAVAIAPVAENFNSRWIEDLGGGQIGETGRATCDQAPCRPEEPWR